jgi:hypothetical protein
MDATGGIFVYLGVDKGLTLVPKRGRLRAEGAGDFSEAEDGPDPVN